MSPSTCRNRSSDRSAPTIRGVVPPRALWQRATTNAVTSPAVNCSSSTRPARSRPARNGRTSSTLRRIVASASPRSAASQRAYRASTISTGAVGDGGTGAGTTSRRRRNPSSGANARLV
jgi:hypothetical protein